MATYTSNLNLKKPNAEDFYNIADFNGNSDILDTEVAKKVDKVTGGTEGNFAKLDANGGIADSGTSADNITNHMATNVTAENGVHGIRYNDNKLQYYDNSTWNDAKTGTHLYMSDWKLICYYSGQYYYANFRMLTSYNPTATNLATFKQMLGTNVGSITNRIMPYVPSIYTSNNYMYIAGADITNSLFSCVLSSPIDSISVDESNSITISKASSYQIF